SVIALAVAAGSVQPVFADSQADATGFLEGAKLNVKARFMYMLRALTFNLAPSRKPVASACESAKTGCTDPAA
ncbi:hypothetical protein QCD79_33770, partial [Pseudomonas quasicaspiana]|nr:hypothetical protein [Pseudomonas quasicaspiana]